MPEQESELYVVTEQNVFAQLDIKDESKQKVSSLEQQRLIKEAIEHNASIVK